MSISERTLIPGESLEVRHPLERPKLATHPEGESRTHQSMYDSTRIQTIYERFTRNGELPGSEERRARAQYADVSELNRDRTDLEVKRQDVFEEMARRAPQVISELRAKRATHPKKTDAAPGGSAQVVDPAPVATPPKGT